VSGLAFTISSQEMEQVYSYNPGARTGLPRTSYYVKTTIATVQVTLFFMSNINCLAHYQSSQCGISSILPTCSIFL